MLEVASINSGFIKKSGHGKYVVCLAHNDDGLSFEKREEFHAAMPGTSVVIDDFTILKT